MEVESKLDEILAVLLRIEKLLQHKSNEEIIAQDVVVKKNPTPNPTKSQLEFQRRILFAIRMSRTHYFTAIRSYALRISAIRDREPGFMIGFELEKVFENIEKKIKQTGAQFYKDLFEQVKNQQKGIMLEGVQVYERAIKRLTARAK